MHWPLWRFTKRLGTSLWHNEYCGVNSWCRPLQRWWRSLSQVWLLHQTVSSWRAETRVCLFSALAPNPFPHIWPRASLWLGLTLWSDKYEGCSAFESAPSLQGRAQSSWLRLSKHFSPWGSWSFRNSPFGEWGQGGKKALGWERGDLLITLSAVLGGCNSLSGLSFPTVKWADQTWWMSGPSSGSYTAGNKAPNQPGYAQRQRPFWHTLSWGTQIRMPGPYTLRESQVWPPGLLAPRYLPAFSLHRGGWGDGTAHTQEPACHPGLTTQNCVTFSKFLNLPQFPHP